MIPDSRDSMVIRTRGCVRRDWRFIRAAEKCLNHQLSVGGRTCRLLYVDFCRPTDES